MSQIGEGTLAFICPHHLVTEIDCPGKSVWPWENVFLKLANAGCSDS